MKPTKRPDLRADPDKKQRAQRRKLWREYLGCAQAGGGSEAARKRSGSVCPWLRCGGRGGDGRDGGERGRVKAVGARWYVVVCCLLVGTLPLKYLR
jgi:hypothetical protein